MGIRRFVVRDHPELLGLIEGMRKEDLILDDYFYVPSVSIFDKEELYTDWQLALILYITDSEYRDLVDLYLSNQSNLSDAYLTEQNNKKIRLAELEKRLEQSKKAEQNQRRLTEIKTGLDEIEKKLKSFNTIEEQERKVRMELSKFSGLLRFNLQKIHDDLVDINNQINELEDKFLQLKSVQIKHHKPNNYYDKSIIGLGIGILSGACILGGVSYLMSVSVWLTFSVLLVGSVVSAVFFLSAKKKIDMGLGSGGAPDFQSQIIDLKKRRASILNLVNVQSADEFFLVKAKISSNQKILETLKAQKEKLARDLNYDVLVQTQKDLEAEKKQIESESDHTPDKILSAEDALSIYKEIDSLKLAISGDHSKMMDRATIIQKLSDIRADLRENVENYKDGLASVYRRSVQYLRDAVSKVSNSIGIYSFNIDEDLSNWNSLSKLQRLIVYFVTAREFHNGKLFLIIEKFNDWRVEESMYLDRFLNYLNNDKELTSLILTK